MADYFDIETFLSSADQYINEAKLEEALDYYYRALQLSPNDRDIWEALYQGARNYISDVPDPRRPPIFMAKVPAKKLISFLTGLRAYLQQDYSESIKGFSECMLPFERLYEGVYAYLCSARKHLKVQALYETKLRSGKVECTKFFMSTAKQFVDERKFEYAFECLHAALQLMPKDRRIWEALWHAARVYVSRLPERPPIFFAVVEVEELEFFLKGLFSYIDEKYSDSLVFFEKICGPNENVSCYIDYAKAFLQDVTEAAIYKYLAAKFPTSSVTWVNEERDIGLSYDIEKIDVGGRIEYVVVQCTRDLKNSVELSPIYLKQALTDDRNIYSAALVSLADKKKAKVNLFQNLRTLWMERPQIGRGRLQLLLKVVIAPETSISVKDFAGLFC